MKKVFLLVLCLLFFSIGISALVGEFIVRGVLPQITYKQARVVGLRIYETSEVVPFALKPNLETNHLGYTREFDHRVRTNNLGFRGNDLSPEKQSSVFRILVLGDSMTFGWGVEDDDTFPARIEKYLNHLSPDKKVEVINAGFADGYSPDSYYAFMRDIGLSLKPDLVLLTLFPYNDISDMLEMEWTKVDELGYPLAVQSLDRTARNGYQVFRKKTEWKYEIPVLKNSHLAMLLFQAMERNTPKAVDAIEALLDVHDPPNRTSREEVDRCIYASVCEEKFNKPLEKLGFLFNGFKNMSDDNGFKFAVILMPSPDQAKKVSQEIIQLKNPRLPETQQPQDRLTEQLTELGVNAFDLLPVLSSSEVKGYFYERDGHLTAKGALVVARDLIRKLIDSRDSLMNTVFVDHSSSTLIEKLNDLFSASDY